MVARDRRPLVRAIGAVTTAGLLSLAGAWAVFRPMGAWLRYPLAYSESADGLVNLWVVKTIVDTGWFARNEALGAPFGATFLDFAHPEVLFLAAYRAATAFTSDIALLHNAFYVAAFPLIAWSALAVLRGEFRIAWPLAVAGALAFAWLPYRFLRLEHMFLSNYVAVPAAAWLLVRLAGDRPPFFEHGRLRPPGTLVWLAVMLVGWTSGYYAFFAVVLIGVLGPLQAIVARSWRPAVSALLLAGCVAGALLVATAPFLQHRRAEGVNAAVARRAIAESEVYALRPLHLVLPSDAHRVPAAAWLARSYNSQVPHINENRWAALGLLGSAGFVLLLLHLLTGRVLPDVAPFPVLARANLVATLFGITGGAGVLVALVVTPQFRALNRLSVFIAFFSIAAVVAALDRALDGRRRSSAWRMVAATLLVLLALADQPPGVRPDSDAIARAYDSDRAFVHRIEQVLPPGAMVYQLPHTQFPEMPPLRNEPYYSPMRMYLHSSTLRWSYGDMIGRPADHWHQAVAGLPLRERVAVLVRAGFRGLIVDRQALPRRGRDEEEALAAMGASPAFSSADGTLVFFGLPLPSAAAGADDAFVAAPARGFYRREGTYPDHWSWSSGDAEILVHHFSADDRAVALTGVLQSLVPRRIAVLAGDARVDLAVAGGNASAPLRLVFHLRPGWNTIRLQTEQPPTVPPGDRDRRRLAFMVTRLRVSALDPPDRAGWQAGAGRAPAAAADGARRAAR